MIIQNRIFCLASSSPRRQELLKRYGVDFAICAPNIDESQKDHEEIQVYSQRISYEKAVVGAQQYPDAIVLAGDTTVYYDHQMIGKPTDEKEGYEMLNRLSGEQHNVYSSYTLLDAHSNRAIEGTVCTKVKFKPLSSDWIRWYVSTGEPMDKAGAYSIQGLGTVMVEEIQGSYNNVVGFPIENIFWHLIEEGWITLS